MLMDFTEQAKAIVGRVIQALSVSSESPEAMRYAACEDVAAALQSAYEAGKKMGVKESHDENVTARVFEFANLVNEARTSGGIVDCTGAKAVVRKSLSPLMTTLDGWIVQDGDWVHHNGSAYLVTDGKIPVAVQLQSCGAPYGWRDITAGECYAVDPKTAAEAGRKV